MKNRFYVTLCNVKIALGKTKPKELEAAGFLVDYRRAVQFDELQILNCDLYIDKRQVAVLGFEGEPGKCQKENIENKPITSIFLDVPSLGFIFCGHDFSFSSQDEIMNEMVDFSPTVANLPEASGTLLLCDEGRIAFVFEEKSKPMCMLITL